MQAGPLRDAMMTRLRHVVAGVCAGVAALGIVSAGAAASPVFKSEQANLELVSAATSAGEARTIRLGLHFKLQPGWKVYWRSPGPGGYPPRVDWSGSSNLAVTEMHWPAPERFEILGFESLGYTDEVVYPITATVERPGQALQLRAQVDFLTCKEICIPYRTALSLDIPAGPASSSIHGHLIDRFFAQVPGDGTASGLAVERVTVTGSVAAPTLRVLARAQEPLERPDVFLEGPEGFEFGSPEVSVSPDGRTAVLTVGAGAVGEEIPDLAGQLLTLTVVDGQRSVETVLVPERGIAAAAPAAPATSLLLILGLAVLGGLILNLMPCVLPVLSIKLLGVVSHGGGDPGRVRLRFLASVAGILASFMLLAAATVGVKAAGMAVGWGIQFQQPVFLIAMVLIVTLFAANLWSLFDVRLPGPLAQLGATGGSSEGYTGDFLTGAFATLLATPCSAPFLGTAVGFALARGPLEIFLVFGALGMGLALPYLAVAAMPRLATRLPKPGPWMVWLRQILGLALAATAVWLLTVLAAQTGPGAAAAVGALMLVALILLWLRRKLADGRVVLASIGAIALLSFAAPALLPTVASDRTGATSAGLESWQPFDRSAINALVAEGRTVFVDVTADWCITCQANKKLVLNRGAVADRLGDKDVVAMVADWTRPDDGIANYLANYGRYGIPFNIVYGPGAPGGIPLPELLTADSVLSAMDRATGAAKAVAGTD